MTGNPECFARMWEVGRKVGATFSVIHSVEGVIVSRYFPQRTRVYGVASLWRDSAKSSCTRVLGIPNHDLRGRPALTRWILRLTISPETIRRMDSEAIAATAGVPERGVRSQSNTDYVVRGERGDPRGRKSGADLGAANPR